MDPVSGALGIVTAVFQSYEAVMGAYNLYLGYNEFSTTYRDIRMCLIIEQCRLELWADLMHLKEEGIEHSLSMRDLAIWKLFEMIVDSILVALQESNEKLEKLGHRTGQPVHGNTFLLDLLGGLSLSASEKPKWNPLFVHRKIKFVLRDQGKMRDLVKNLRYYNDSLEKMASQLDRDTLQRQLRTQFVTVPKSEVAEVRQAATLLEHKDIKHLANARLLLEEDSESDTDGETLHEWDEDDPDSLCMDLNDVKFHTSRHITDRPRAIAEYNNEQVIIDWRTSEDDNWRNDNPRQFRQRKENLTKILNRDLHSLDLSVLHCVGYLNQSRTVTGYAFHLPPNVRKPEKHRTLYDLISADNELPDIGERFLLAQALVRTVNAIQSVNWLHKNISSRNILFWPSQDNDQAADILHPYLMGFDIARSNEAIGHTEGPARSPYDDHYRHPRYRERLEAKSPISENGKSPQPRFRLSYDIYSLGVVLYEIGIWRNFNIPVERRSSHGRRITLAYNTDPKLVQRYLDAEHLKELKKRMGHRYANVVLACLDGKLDEFWEEEATDEYSNSSVQLQQYLKHVQNRIVDPLSVCRA